MRADQPWRGGIGGIALPSADGVWLAGLGGYRWPGLAATRSLSMSRFACWCWRFSPRYVPETPPRSFHSAIRGTGRAPSSPALILCCLLLSDALGRNFTGRDAPAFAGGRAAAADLDRPAVAGSMRRTAAAAAPVCWETHQHSLLAWLICPVVLQRLVRFYVLHGADHAGSVSAWRMRQSGNSFIALGLISALYCAEADCPLQHGTYSC